MSIKIAAVFGKAIGCSILGGLVTAQGVTTLSRVGVPHISEPILKGLVVSGGAGCGFLLYARYYIQGYWFDKIYPTPKNIGELDFQKKVAIVTGGTIGGLGYSSAQLLGELGVKIVITVRSREKGEAAVQSLKEVCGHDRIHYTICEFSDLDSVRKAADEILSKQDRLDYLILNAGIGSAKHKPSMWQINQVGPFEFVQKLRPLLVKTAKMNNDFNGAAGNGVRVVAVSSGAHSNSKINYDDPYYAKGAYGQSKLAQIMHMRELQKRIRMENPELNNEMSFRCYAITPGLVATNIFADAPFPALFKGMIKTFLARTPIIGAQVIKMASLDPTLPGGSYLSNCYVKPTNGYESCENDPSEWRKCWELCEKCIQDDAYSKLDMKRDS